MLILGAHREILGLESMIRTRIGQALRYSRAALRALLSFPPAAPGIGTGAPEERRPRYRGVQRRSRATLGLAGRRPTDAPQPFAEALRQSARGPRHVVPVGSGARSTRHRCWPYSPRLRS